jgi:hypothetical protein
MASVGREWKQRGFLKVHVKSNKQVFYVNMRLTVRRSFKTFSEGRRLITKKLTNFI